MLIKTTIHTKNYSKSKTLSKNKALINFEKGTWDFCGLEYGHFSYAAYANIS